jgi:hypothetical protein
MHPNRAGPPGAVIGEQSLSLANRDGDTSTFTRMTRKIYGVRTQAGIDYKLTAAMLDLNLSGGGPIRFGLYSDAAMISVLAEIKVTTGSMSHLEWTDFSATYSNATSGHVCIYRFRKP